MLLRAGQVVAIAAILSACSSSEPPQALPGTIFSETTVATSLLSAEVSTVTSTTMAPAPVGAAALAQELSAVEAALRTPLLAATELDELGRRQQLVYRAINQHPEWHADIVSLIKPVASVALGFHLVARQAFADHAAGRPPTEPATTLPAWTIVEPLPTDELRGYYAEAELATGVPWQYLAAIHFQETRMGRIVGVSSAGAVGPMQFLPSTWQQCCDGDPTVARDAILGAARYLVLGGAPDDMQAALNSYNPNAGYVGAVTAYAQNMIADERAYLGYHGWQVFYGTSEGTVRLPVGYNSAKEIDVAAYLLEHPDGLMPPG